MRLMIEACTKKARTGWKRRTWWEEHEGEDELLSYTTGSGSGTKKICRNKGTKFVG
jgi:hypothetical protein